MKIELKEITVGELAEGYDDQDEGGVFGYSGKLDIRPPYQREFIYKDKQRDAVIDTVTKDFPLNVMYWAVRDDGDFEIIDGQQRTISVCQYVTGDFAFQGKYFFNLQDDEKEQILEYPLTVYQCSGTDSERLDWFRIINIAGVKLSDQELRNAVYSGSWVTDAKRFFSKNQCPASGLGKDYLSGEVNRQIYLETAIKWISEGNIEEFMAQRQHEPSANELWLYFQKVIAWVKATFSEYRREMKGLAWGELYNEYKDAPLDPTTVEDEVAKLMVNEEVQKKKGIYPYVLGRDERHLNLRQFSDEVKREAYERQKGVCAMCGKGFPIEEMEADHIKPWTKEGKTIPENCQMLCRDDNRRKGAK